MLEQWDLGVPDRIVEVDDAAWQWAGPWKRRRPVGTGARARARGRRAGAEATLTFTGKVVTSGPLCRDGGRAE